MIFGLSACSDTFLETVPDNASSISVELTNKTEAREFLNSGYNSLTDGAAYGGQFALISELMADGIDGAFLEGDWLAHYSRSTDLFLGTTRGMMESGYRASGRANNVLDQIPALTDMTDAEKQAFEGEVKFIRSMVYFDLVRFFGQPHGYTPDNSQLGIAVRTTQSIDIVDRSSVADVYALVISDLQDAVNLLPANNDIYANSWAAKALLAKVYFQMNDFQNAFDMANDVITNGPFSFDTDFSLKYGFGDSGEVIFGLLSTHLDFDNANGGLRGYHRPDPSNGLPAVFASSDIVNSFPGDDARRSAWFADVNGRFACTKFGVDNVYTNPVIHLTEMKLIRGESAAELGNAPMGVADLNDIRERAGLVALSDALAGEPLIQNLRLERRKELYFENNRMHELKRQAVKDSPNLLIRNAPWDCPGMVCQIPDNELKGNPNMQSNPQAGCE